MPTADPLAWALGLGLLGAIVGSFEAALVMRWTRGESVAGGRSRCDACGRTLGPAELVPLASWLLLRGRCRACGARIDPVHPAIELAAVLVGASGGLVAPGVVGASGAVFGWLLIALAALDLRAWWLPDRLTGMLALAGLATGLAGLDPPMDDRAFGGVAGCGGLWLVAAGYRRLRGREGMGGGDPKLAGAIGLWLGWRLLPAVLLLAALTGLGVVGWRAATGRAVDRHDPLPFGALLAIGAYPAWLAMVGSAP